MSCDEISELLPAYVLGALDVEEFEAVEAHLREGHEHDEELVELRATVFALDRFGEDVALESPPQSMSLPTERSRRLSRTGRPPVWLAAVAAAVVLAVFGAGWLIGDLVDGSGQGISIEVQGADGRHLVLDAGSGTDSVTVTMAGFDRLSDDQQYQIWAIRDGEWQRIGNCNTNPRGWWRGDFTFTVQPGEQVAVTIEPTGGSPTPTSEPIFISGQ